MIQEGWEESIVTYFKELRKLNIISLKVIILGTISK
jgi:hypothetical protein